MKTYTLKEVLKMLNISQRTWLRRKDEVLEFINIYWDYSVQYSNNGNIKLNVYEEEPQNLPKLPKKQRDTIKTNRNLYFDFALDTLKKNKYQTGVSIAFLAKVFNIEPEGKEYAESTIARLVAPFLKQVYKQLPKEAIKKVWVYKVNSCLKSVSCYERMPQEHVDWLIDKYIFAGSDRAEAENILAIYSSGKTEARTRDEVDLSAGRRSRTTYEKVISEFLNNFGYYPISIKVIDDDSIVENIDVVKLRNEVIAAMDKQQEE